tara:strand:- start:186 stop:908 length:723 start_codon:yes stop_codon:yes gene_type:complete
LSPRTHELKRALLGAIGFSIILLLETGCLTTPPTPVIREAHPQPGFCEKTDAELRAFVIEMNVKGFTSATAVATTLGGNIFILTNRHNLPEEILLENISFRNNKYQYSNAAGILQLGISYAMEQGLGIANDYAILVPAKPHIFHPLPLYFSRYSGEVVVPSYAARLYTVGRGSQWYTDHLFDRLDVFLEKGASGAPVLTCQGEIAGLYTALIRPEDFERAGFKAISTPSVTIIKHIKQQE